jgi:hypothetical protein
MAVRQRFLLLPLWFFEGSSALRAGAFFLCAGKVPKQLLGCNNLLRG